MKGHFRTVALVAACVLTVAANEHQIDQKEANRQQCSGMYSRKAWGGNVDPFILTHFEKQTPDGDKDPIVSLVIFEWRDEGFVGRFPDPAAQRKEFICDDENIKANLCNETDIGAFIINPSAIDNPTSPIINEAVHLKDPHPIKYPIKRTGYYCVTTYGYSADEYNALVVFRNSYGELPAAQIAKLPFYGGITIVYAVLGVFWAFLYVQHRHDILAVQNYITAIIVLLIVEMLITWGFYEYKNRHGSNVGAKVMMVIVAVINAGRNSFSFMLLLIVCLGYGVVKPTLGKTMLLVRALAGGHFVFGVIYAVASLSITPESAGPLVLLVILPLAGTLTAFYVWTLNALGATMKDLMERKQTVKARMYRKLFWCLVGSIGVIFGFFFVNSFSFAGHSDPDFVPDHWQTRWFILDGWLNLVYLVDLAYIAYLWRPTANNRRFAMSDELAQDDEGFEVTSFRGSLDEEAATAADRETQAGNEHTSSSSSISSTLPPTSTGNNNPVTKSASKTTKAQGPPPNGTTTATTATATDHRHPRESLDGEPIFAVGEDGERWSDDEEDDDDDDDDDGEVVEGGEGDGDGDERKRLTRTKKTTSKNE